jgi:hypothetical protein
MYVSSAKLNCAAKPFQKRTLHRTGLAFSGRASADMLRGVSTRAPDPRSGGCEEDGARGATRPTLRARRSGFRRKSQAARGRSWLHAGFHSRRNFIGCARNPSSSLASPRPLRVAGGDGARACPAVGHCPTTSHKRHRESPFNKLETALQQRSIPLYQRETGPKTKSAHAGEGG